MNITFALMNLPILRASRAANIAATFLLFNQGSLFGDELDNLLNPSREVAAPIVDQTATEAWNGVVDAFRKNDLNKASELGQTFLNSNFRPSPFQLLGVQVMMGLANAQNPAAIADASLAAEATKLATERSEITAKYVRLQEIVQASNARINKLTNNRKQAVQAGTAAYQECVRCDANINQSNAEMAALQPSIDANKLKTEAMKLRANSKLKTDTLRLLDMLTQAGEIDAAFAVANVYIRVVGSDLDIAKKQQDVIRLQAVQQKANKVVAVIEGQQKSLVSEKKYWSALDIGQKGMAKVEMTNDPDLARLVSSGIAIDSLGITKAILRARAEASAIIQLSKTDARKAQIQFLIFRSAYPDCPDLTNIGIQIEGIQSEEMKTKVADLLTSVESLAESNPEQASTLLARIDESAIDPVERTSLEARIASIRGKIISSSIQDLSISLEATKEKLGGEVKDFFVQNKERIKSGIFSDKKSELTASLKIRIDKTAELPEVLASLEGLDATIVRIEKLKPSETQTMQLTGIKTEVGILRATIK